MSEFFESGVEVCWCCRCDPITPAAEKVRIGFMLPCTAKSKKMAVSEEKNLFSQSEEACSLISKIIGDCEDEKFEEHFERLNGGWREERAIKSERAWTIDGGDGWDLEQGYIQVLAGFSTFARDEHKGGVITVGWSFQLLSPVLLMDRTSTGDRLEHGSDRTAERKLKFGEDVEG